MTPFFTTTLAAAAAAGDTNIKVASVTAMVRVRRSTSTPVRRTRAASSRRSTRPGDRHGRHADGAARLAHASGVQVTPAGQQIIVDPGATGEDATIQVVGTAGAAGTGITLTAPLANAHAVGAQVDDRTINVEVDQSAGGNQETVTVTNVGTAGAAGTGVDFAPALARNHWFGVHVATTTAPQVGHTGDIGGVPLVQPASGLRTGRGVRPARRAAGVERRQLVDVERLRRPLLGGDADHAEHDGGTQRAADPDVAASDVGDRRRGEHLRRVADAELPHRKRRRRR